MSYPQDPYLVRLAGRLASGMTSFPEERRRRHREFILRHQLADGGFRGREGDSDLYYTSFAVRGLMMLGGLDEPVTAVLSEYLAGHDWRRLNVIDLMNWLSSAMAVQLAGGPALLPETGEDWSETIASRLEQVRTPDGGYGKSPAGASGSTYHSFLVMLTYQLIGRSVPRRNALIQFLYDRQRSDGGFVEIAPMKRSGTNPTAAAAAILRELGNVDDELREDLSGFFREVLSEEGGFQANSRVPFADSLSTFTAVLTTQDLALKKHYDANRIRFWIETQLEFPTGGFRAATWDENADVEYTFYGLGLLALLSAE